MTDRELLELAAKAAGMLYLHHYEPANQALLVPQDEDGNAIEWNPLADDGDALRLAVKLGMSIEIEHYEESTYAYAGESPREYAIENWKGDRHSATRRAIVRAAAEIERTK